MSGDRYFADTNLLLYSIDASEPRKQARAWEWLDALWKQSSGNLSWQVLHEFYVNATRKMKVDALIVAAAERAGCGILLSEDFQDGRKFGTVKVVNPFGSVGG